MYTPKKLSIDKDVKKLLLESIKPEDEKSLAEFAKSPNEFLNKILLKKIEQKQSDQIIKFLLAKNSNVKLRFFDPQTQLGSNSPGLSEAEKELVSRNFC